MPAFWSLLDPEAAAALTARGARRSFRRGEALMHTGQVASDVLIVRAGRVKVSATTTGGRTVLLAFRGPGDLVGELAALDESPRSASIAAIDPVDVLALAHADFRTVLSERPDVARALLRVLTERLRDADAKRVQLAAYTTMGRVAFCLLELCERFGEPAEGSVDIQLPLSQDELAGWAGASLESVGRALSSMRGLGWVQTRRRAITVLDQDALRRVTAAT
jgi:CRP/FNR family transcriptional regulator, cyclic AMP receptor protein